MNRQSADQNKKIAALISKINSQEKQIKTLNKSVQKYKNFFDISNNAIFIVDFNGKIKEVNKVACERYCYTPKEYSSMSYFDLIPKSKRKIFKDNFDQITSSDSLVFDTVNITSKRKSIPVELNTRVFKYNGREALIMIAKDISNRKIYLEQFENEKDLFQILMDNIPDRIYFKDVNSKFTHVNKAQSRNFHLKDPSEAIGLCDHDFFDKKHADQALNDERKIIRTKKAIISKFEREKIQISGRDYEWVNSTKVPIINKNGKVTGIVGISRNVTDLKNAENKILKYAKELQYLNAGKDKFFSILAHDLKNPFFSLLGFAELLVTNYHELPDENKLEYIKNILKISKNSYRLLENLLHWASAQTGRIEYRPKEIDLKSLIDDGTEFFNPIAEKKDIWIENNVKNPVMVYADSDMMRTVIRNLITNSVKFTSNGGKVQIDAVDEKSHYKVTVTDSGKGMDSEILKKLFRIDVNHKSIGTCNEEGTGLGLIICKEFVEKNGGYITVSSRRGKGSKFSFTVPKSK